MRKGERGEMWIDTETLHTHTHTIDRDVSPRDNETACPRRRRVRRMCKITCQYSWKQRTPMNR